MAKAPPIIRIEGLRKTYRLGFAWTKIAQALHGLDLTVHAGEVLGFLGPNGAGKTTTLKILMGLMRPSAGKVEVFGHPAGEPAANRQIGFLPENPYFYGYLTGPEFMDLCGRLHGLDRSTRRARTESLLARVGLEGQEGKALRKYSKGMLQRVGLAQALIGEPKLVVLDEPQTGLDPLGRKEVRDIIRELGQEGRTVVFSSHILGDVEMVCDRVALLIGGRLQALGPLSELLQAKAVSTTIILEGGTPPFTVPDELEPEVESIATESQTARVRIRGEGGVDGVIQAAVAGGWRVVRVTPHRETLEDLFVREAAAAGAEGGA